MISHPPSGDLQSYLDEQSSPEQRSAVEAHCRTCIACARSLDELRAVRTAIRETADIDLPFGFALRLARAIAADGSTNQTWDGVEAVARNAVAAIAFVVLCVIVLTSFPLTAQELPTEAMIVSGQSDSVSSRVFVKQGEISRDDLIYAVVSR